MQICLRKDFSVGETTDREREREYPTVNMAADRAAVSLSCNERCPSKDCQEGEICFACSDVILEADAERDGERPGKTVLQPLHEPSGGQFFLVSLI